MRLRAIAGLLTLSLVATACGFIGGDEEVPEAAPIVAQQLPATSNDAETVVEETTTTSTLIPTTTIVTYPDEGVIVEIGQEPGPVPQTYLDRSTQIDVIHEMVAAQVTHDWDAVYSMATPENQAACPMDQYEALTADMPKRDAEIAFGEMQISHSSDGVFAGFDLITPADFLPAGFRVGTSPDLITNRVVPTEDVNQALGDLTANGQPHELKIIPEYEIEGVVAHVAGQMLVIQDEQLMMAENPCVVAEMAAKTTGGLNLWTYEAVEVEAEATT